MKYRKKPVNVNAVRWTGESACLEGSGLPVTFHRGSMRRKSGAIMVDSLNGQKVCNVGDWLVEAGSVVRVLPDEIFQDAYEPVEE